MAIRYSQSTILYLPVRCDTSAHMRADIDAVLLACGWTHVRSVTNGWVYEAQSPDGLQFRVLIQDQGRVNPFVGTLLSIQFMSADETLKGTLYDILYGDPARVAIGYQIVANCCQFFLSLKTVSFGTIYNAISGGIPALPPDTQALCTQGIGERTVTMLWWSCGNPDPELATFKNGFACVYYDHALNGTLFASGVAGFFEVSSLRIFPFAATIPLDSPVASKPFTVKSVTGFPLFVDTFIGWGWQIQGQLWDSFQATDTYQPVDTVMTFHDTTSAGGDLAIQAVAYNECPPGVVSPPPVGGGTGTYFSQLWLLTGTPSGAGFGNVQY